MGNEEDYQDLKDLLCTSDQDYASRTVLLSRLMEREKEIPLLKRGIDLAEIQERLVPGFDQDQYRLFLDRLFLFGDKSSRCLTIPQGNKDEDPLWEFDIIDASGVVFEKLFDRLNWHVTSKGRLDRSPDLCAYFKDQQNLSSFIKSINDLNEHEKLLVRDHYLKILHQLCDTVYMAASHFISTSESAEIAYDFAKKSTYSAVLYLWNPINLYQELVRTAFKKSGLPEILYPPIPYEEEDSVKGVIFPHFLIGIKDLITKEFHWNDWFKMEGQYHEFNDIKDIIADFIIENGLIVDQSKFQSEIKETQHTKSISKDADGKYRETDIKQG